MAFRLSNHQNELKSHYDVIVIGSGYGASVSASRLARCGLKVAVLERGKEYPIGSLPDTIAKAGGEFQLRGLGRKFGSYQGLFDFRLGDDIHILMGCGLGGTSLINANVCLKPDPRLFDDPRWPDAVRTDGTLVEGFARARRMLRPNTYPGQPPLQKVEALAVAASALGADLEYVPLHVTFAERANAANIIQPACTLCGDCMSGCNVGAKTTTVVTYLADASAHGAEIFTHMPVRSIGKNPDGTWRVHVVRPDQDKEGDGLNTLINADRVVLGAGTLGSTEIMLRSRALGLPLSDLLGHGFSGNGDMITIGYNNDIPINGIGVGHPSRVDVPPVGPAVAGLIDLRNTDDLDNGIAVVEASIPSSMAAILGPGLALGGGLFARDTDHSLVDELDEMGRAALSLVQGAYRGAVHNTQTMLAIGHDDASGELILEDDSVKVKYPGLGRQQTYQHIDQICSQAVAATGGSYMRNPLSESAFGGNPLSVHPLGGCRMAEDRSEGVVNHMCEVFDGTPSLASDAIHQGLYICDGSVLPRGVGIHPLFTITALIERAMLHIGRANGWTFNDEMRKSRPQRLT